MPFNESEKWQVIRYALNGGGILRTRKLSGLVATFSFTPDSQKRYYAERKSHRRCAALSRSALWAVVLNLTTLDCLRTNTSTDGGLDDFVTESFDFVLL